MKKQKDKKPQKLSPLGTYREGMEWNPVEKVIMERRSIRDFKSVPVPEGMIKRVLEAGRFAPSAGNCQPWRFIVINNPEIIQAMENDISSYSRRVMWFLDYTRSRFRQIFTKPFIKLIIRMQKNDLHPVPFALFKRIAEGKSRVFYGAPTLIIILEDKRGVGTPSLDAGICGQNMVLAAHSMGAGTCWVEFVKILNNYRKWRKFLGIRYPYRLNSSIAIGWPGGKYDAEVPREVQMVEWFRGGISDQPDIEKQGE